MVGIHIKDIDFLEIEERVVAGLAEVIANYLNERLTYDEAWTKLEQMGLPSAKAHELLEKGLNSL